MPADVAQAMLKEEKATQEKELELESFEGLPSLLSVMEQTAQGVKEDSEKQEEEKSMEVEVEEDNESESSSFDENDPFF